MQKYVCIYVLQLDNKKSMAKYKNKPYSEKGYCKTEHNKHIAHKIQKQGGGGYAIKQKYRI